MTVPGEAAGAVLLARLEAVLAEPGPLAVAVSGGVDSVTLACAAHRRAPGPVTVFHAVSPAVPREATARVRALAAREGWRLAVIDAGEFADESYLQNPVNRCFHCKTGLYGAIVRAAGGAAIASGTNTDDLGDYRPGLAAAAAHGVRHPFVEAGIGKDGVRRIARALGLGAVAELPASPCLSSRIETGLRIEAGLLATVERIEAAARDGLRRIGGSDGDLRCRRRREGYVMELEPALLALLTGAAGEGLRRDLAGLAGGALRFEPYRRGSAFLREAGAGDRVEDGTTMGEQAG